MGPSRYSYAMMASALGVSKRTLIRYVVTGSLPSPEYRGGACYWEGEDLRRALDGPSLPGTHVYTPAAKVLRQRDTIRAVAIAAEVAAQVAAEAAKKPAKKPAKRGRKKEGK